MILKDRRGATLPRNKHIVLLAGVIGLSAFIIGGEVIAYRRQMAREAVSPVAAEQITIPQILVELNKQLDPEYCLFLNNRRADALHAQLASSMPPPDRMNTEIKYAE